MQWEVVIGLETHTQLATRSKIFSGASTAFGAAPNTQASAVDLALPGVLPVLNRAVVDCAIRLGLALGSSIAPSSVFARKNYFYPDLPKGYQISQYETPVVAGGTLDIIVPAAKGGEAVIKTVRLTRAHLEEDAGKSLHEDYAGQSGIDLNRAGTPLLEIVSEPDMRSAVEAVAYARTLNGLVTWLGICDGNMQEGSFRVDANVSVRPAGQEAYGTRCEIKNLNSFRFLERAINFEIRRQIELIEDGGKVVQETRLFDPDKGETRPMRSKEDAQDYRYVPDPDLLPLEIPAAWIEEVARAMPTLPGELRARYEREHGLSPYVANLLTETREKAAFFERVREICGSAALAANWVTGNVAALLNDRNLDFAAAPVSADAVGTLLERIEDGTLSGKAAKEVLLAMADGEADPDAVIEKRGLKQISDTGALEAAVDKVLAANPKLVDDYRGGKEKAFNSLVGQVMKATQGKANPVQVNAILKRRLSGEA